MGTRSAERPPGRGVVWGTPPAEGAPPSARRSCNGPEPDCEPRYRPGLAAPVARPGARLVADPPQAQIPLEPRVHWRRLSGGEPPGRRAPSMAPALASGWPSVAAGTGTHPRVGTRGAGGVAPRTTRARRPAEGGLHDPNPNDPDDCRGRGRVRSEQWIE